MIHVMFRCHIGLNLNVVRQLMVDEEVVIECMKSFYSSITSMYRIITNLFSVRRISLFSFDASR